VGLAYPIYFVAAGSRWFTTASPAAPRIWGNLNPWTH